MVKFLADLVDSNGRQLLTDASNPATPVSGGQGAPGVGALYGRPVVEVNSAEAAWEVTGTSATLMVGDLKRYATLQQPGIRVEVSDVAADVFLKDQVIWKFVQRRDGAVTGPEAFKKSLLFTS
jgi:HK97 family phage major capsid protein